MTAEIAILNKEAIAIAADSAVTIYQEKDQKIFQSANKIFSLSKYQPVGIMIYGSAKFLGVPWETIIKVYRKKLGNKRYPKLENYASEFINFLNNNHRMFPDDLQKMFVEAYIVGYYGHMRKNMEKEFKRILQEKKEIAKPDVRKAMNKVVNEHYNLWKKADKIPGIPDNHINNFKEKYGDYIKKAKEQVFENMPFSKPASRQLKEITENLYVKYPEELQHTGSSGIVIAGFGSQEIYPSIRSFMVDGMANNYVKYRIDAANSFEIGYEIDSAIRAFAQKEMVVRFMEGVDPGYQNAVIEGLGNMFEQYPSIIVDSIDKLSGREKAVLKKKLKKTSTSIFEEFEKGLKNYTKSNFVGPIMAVVSMLPKNELAAMAESLVKLTSFKRKVSLQAETVALPIDVAVISKGDGFIWIKRKHYFKPELNPQFFKNYYGAEEDREEEDGEEK